jgi:hypothetical protein
MTHGFDVSSPLVCEGIIGDGCGGGRIFFIESETLFAHDPQTKENIILLSKIHKPQFLNKKGCIVTIVCTAQIIEFDLSSMRKTTKKI